MRKVLYLFTQFALLAHAMPQATDKYTPPQIKRISETTIQVSTNDPKPLSQILLALRVRFGLIIDYEDPRYVDTETRSSEHGKVVAGGGFSASIPLPEDPSQADALSAIQLLVADYNASGNPGHFVVRFVSPDRIEVIGEPDSDHKPLIDTRITIPRQERTVAQTLGIIRNALALAAGTKVNVGGAFVDPQFEARRVTVGGENVPAGTLLLQLLASDRFERVIWLDYMVDDHGYLLSFSPVQKERTAKDGSVHYELRQRQER